VEVTRTKNLGRFGSTSILQPFHPKGGIIPVGNTALKDCIPKVTEADEGSECDHNVNGYALPAFNEDAEKEDRERHLEKYHGPDIKDFAADE
jgi:hypothetical protein